MHRFDHGPRLHRRAILAATAMLAMGPRAPAQAKLPISFWHGVGGQPGDEMHRICTSFNSSQNDIEVTPFYKGSYAAMSR